MRLGFAVKVLGGGGLPSHDTRRWQSGPDLAVSLDRLDAVLDLPRRAGHPHVPDGDRARALREPPGPAAVPRPAGALRRAARAGRRPRARARHPAQHASGPVHGPELGGRPRAAARGRGARGPGRGDGRDGPRARGGRRAARRRRGGRARRRPRPLRGRVRAALRRRPRARRDRERRPQLRARRGPSARGADRAPGRLGRAASPLPRPGRDPRPRGAPARDGDVAGRRDAEGPLLQPAHRGRGDAAQGRAPAAARARRPDRPDGVRGVPRATPSTARTST